MRSRAGELFALWSKAQHEVWAAQWKLVEATAGPVPRDSLEAALDRCRVECDAAWREAIRALASGAEEHRRC
jgi:hypothetical protein